MILRIAWRIVKGVATGLACYLFYAVILPSIIAGPLWVPALEPKMLAYVCLLVALEIAASALAGHPLSAPIGILAKLLAAVMLYDALNGGLLETSLNGVRVRVDVTPLLNVVVLLTLIYSLLDALARLTSKKASIAESSWDSVKLPPASSLQPRRSPSKP